MATNDLSDPPRTLLSVFWNSSALRLTLLLVAITSGIGWWLELRPVSTVWGSIGEWFAGFAAAGGAVFAGMEIHSSRKQREEEAEQRRVLEEQHREAMARAVGVQGIPIREKKRWMLKYTVHNGGEFPIDDVVLVVSDPGVSGAPQEQTGTAIEVVLGTVMSGQSVQEEVELRFSREPAFSESTRLTGVLFTDTWNQSWYRAPGYLVKRAAPARTC